MHTYYDLEGRNLDYASKFKIPDFVKEHFKVDTLVRYEFTLTFDDHYGYNKIFGTRVITKLIYNSVKEEFYIETWTWNHRKNSDGHSVFLPISERIAEEMLKEKLGVV